MYIFPFPAFLLLAAQQLYILHAVDKLHQIVLIDRHLLEIFSVEVCPFSHEQLHPAYICQTEQNKNQEYFPAVNSQHNTEDDYCKGGEQYVEHRLSKETFYPVMILDTPYQVTGQFTVKEPHGQPHQLGEEIRDERHVDTRTDVEQYATPDYLDKCAAEYQHELGCQN